MRSTWSALVEGRNGAGPITLFDASDYATTFACEVKNFDPAPFVERKKLKEMDRFITLALAAAKMAVDDASLALSEREEERAGCFLGVGLGGLMSIEVASDTLRDRGASKLSPYMIPRIVGSLATGQISIAHRLRGPSFAIGSACATGGHSLGEAAEWIRRGRADVMLAGGSESTITPIGIGGFQAMHALSRRNDSPATASRPFDRDRDGFVCGEGAGVVVLESLTRARRRGARVYAELTGYGASSDAHHITGAAPEGEGCQRSMRMALEDAELAPSDIDYLNAHATSTPGGDKAESDGIVHVFGSHARDKQLAVSATKSMTGHLLGAAGAIEAIVSVLSLRDGVLPPTVNVEHQDPEIPLDIVPNEARRRKTRHVMSNGFGFGGTNATLVFSAM